MYNVTCGKAHTIDVRGGKAGKTQESVRYENKRRMVKRSRRKAKLRGKAPWKEGHRQNKKNKKRTRIT